MNLTTKKILVASAAVLILGGIYAFFKTEFGKLKNACIVLAGGVINQLGFSYVSLSLFVKVTNISAIDMEISDVNLNIYINDLYVSNFKNPNKQQVKPHASSTMQIDVNFNPADLLKAGIKNITTLIEDQSKIVIKVKGTISVGSGIVKVNNYDVEQKMTLKDIVSPDPNKKKQKC